VELSRQSAFALAFTVGFWSLAAQFIFNRIIFFYIANSEYVAASIISIHLVGFWAGSLIARKYRLDVLTLVAATILAMLVANIVVWRVGAAVIGLEYTVVCAVFCGLVLAGLSGALVVMLMGGHGEDGRRIVIADSAGSVLGAVCGGFILVPYFGLSYAFSTVLIIQSIALLFLLWQVKPPKFRVAMFCTLIVATFFVVISSPSVSTPGLLVADGLPLQAVATDSTNKILYSKVSSYGIISVTDDQERQMLIIDNRPLCFTQEGGMEKKSEWIVAVTPIRMMKATGREKLNVANIGLGCGTSLSGILDTLNSSSQVDLIEINPGMPDAQKKFWQHQKHNPSDLRVTTNIEDGFRYFSQRTEDVLYDVVVIDLAWMQNMNATHLFSKEMYENISRNLQPDGVLAIWSEESNPLSPVSLIIYRTLREVFPFVYVDTSMDVALFYASATRDDLINYLPESAQRTNSWISEAGMMAPVNRLDNLVMNRHKFTVFGDSKYEMLSEKYRAISELE
jgi:spermidine synthase